MIPRLISVISGQDNPYFKLLLAPAVSYYLNMLFQIETMTSFAFLSEFQMVDTCVCHKTYIENRLEEEQGIFSAEWNQSINILSIYYQYGVIQLEQMEAIIKSFGGEIEGLVPLKTELNYSKQTSKQLI